MYRNHISTSILKVLDAFLMIILHIICVFCKYYIAVLYSAIKLIVI